MLGTPEDQKEKKKISDRDLDDYGIAWMNLNHSVVITGWGVDAKTGTKYWVVRNSYGDKWGMNGDFLVRRGENDFGISESSPRQPGTTCVCATRRRLPRGSVLRFSLQFD